jgi:hypothetical protein
MKYVAPSAPLSIGGVLDDWIRLFRSSLGACWAPALVAALAGAIVQFALTPDLATSGSSSYLQYLQYWSTLRAPKVLLIDLVYFLVLGVLYGALLAQQAAMLRGEEPFSFGNALSKGLNRVPQLALGFVLLVLILMAIFIPVGIVAAIAMPALRGTAGASALGMLIAVLAITAAVIAVIYVTVRLQLWMSIVFTENLGGATALGRSWELVKGHWWRVAGIGFVAGVVIWIFELAVGAVIAAAVGLLGFHGTSPDLLIRRLQLIGAIGGLARILTMPLLTAVWLAIYHDLILRREGGDLAARAEALGGA